MTHRPFTLHGALRSWLADIDRIALLLYGAVLLLVCATFFRTWHQPILEMHAFRQTQTAISTYWGVEDGWRWAYETPVLGAPWSLPFELPTFQWLAAALWQLTGLTLDQSGRICSFGFHLGCSLLLARVLQALGLPGRTPLIGAALFLLAPVEWFWGRAFLIESCALFLSLAYLDLSLRMLRTLPAAEPAPAWRPLLLRAAAACVLAALAALTKVTTFAIPALVVAVFALAALRQALRGAAAQRAGALARLAVAAALPAFVALAALLAWLHFSDAVKAQNPIAVNLTSQSLRHWNFGTLSQRVSAQLWIDTVWRRSIPESLGIAGFAAIVLSAMGTVRGRALALALGLATAYLGAFLLFTNLHIVHNYYQYAAAVWLVAAAVVVLAELARRAPRIFLLVGLVTIASQVTAFHHGYWRSMTQPIEPGGQRTLDLAQSIREHTAPADVLLIYGADWTSEIAYYAQRRAITVPDWNTLEQQAWTGRGALAAPYAVALVVDCRKAPRSGQRAQIDAAAAAPSWTVDGCILTPVAPPAGTQP